MYHTPQELSSLLLLGCGIRYDIILPWLPLVTMETWENTSLGQDLLFTQAPIKFGDHFQRWFFRKVDFLCTIGAHWESAQVPLSAINMTNYPLSQWDFSQIYHIWKLQISSFWHLHPFWKQPRLPTTFTDGWWRNAFQEITLHQG